MPHPQDSFPLTSTTIRIPSRGLGTFQADPSAYPAGSVKTSVLHALKLGYRHIDAAFAYGRGSVEKEIGEAIREAVKEGVVTREELFVVTKLDNNFHKPEDVEVNMNMSLTNLCLDYVDLYLMHFPFAYATTDGYATKRRADGSGRPVIDIEVSRAWDKTWLAMEALVAKGKTRLIGVSNFSTPRLRRLLSLTTIFPVVNQIEIHAHFQDKNLVAYCLENGIHVTASAPLGGAPIPALKGESEFGPLEDPVVLGLAEKYKRTPAQICLCHTLLRGISVIPKSNNSQRIEENFNVLFEMMEEDIKVMDNLMEERGEKEVRGIERTEYLGFDCYNEEAEEP